MLYTVSAHRVPSAEVPRGRNAYTTFPPGRAFSQGAPTAKLRVVTELYIFLISSVALVAGGLLGAFAERARARSGYLAKQYQDLLAQLFALQHATARARDASAVARAEDASAAARAEDVSKAKMHVLKERSCFEAAVSLFGKKKVATDLRTFYAALEKAKKGTVPDKLDKSIEDLAKAFRGSPLSRLSPQKRWF
jgi:outer membrane murein-binding lipoprotein Lpp